MKIRYAVLPLALAAFCAAGQAAEAGKPPRFATVSLAEAERQVGSLTQESTSAAMYIWTERYVYRPGETLTLRWTVKPNGDLYPYTIVAYRINNQTGVKTYLPGSTEATDIAGNTIAQGFRIQRLAEATKAVLIGANGQFPASAGTIPNELGMHTLVVQLRDYTGTRVVKSAYAKIVVVEGEETLTGNIEANRTLTNNRAYRISGLVFVRNNAVLTIDPGTVIIGQPGSQPPSALVVTRSGRLVANGTRTRPIIMTSSQPVGQRRRGDWGGLVILGRAPNNFPNSEGNIEGLTASEDTRYGGTDAAHNCGSLRYVRVEFAGAEFQPNQEVNAFTWGSCGSATVSEYLQAHYGFDDNFEWFGGSNSARYLVSTYAADDNIDVQIGYTGSIQNVVALQNADRGNRGIEADNNEFNFTATPAGAARMYNMTMVGSGQAGLDEANSPGIFLRRGAAGTYNNMVVLNFSSVGIGFSDDATFANIDNSTLQMNGILLWNNGLGTQAANQLAAQVPANLLTFAQGTRGQGRNFLVADPMLRRPFEFSDPDFRPMPGSPVYRANWVQPPDNGFFDQSANYVGAFGETNWAEEWTNFLQEQDIQP